MKNSSTISNILHQELFVALAVYIFTYFCRSGWLLARVTQRVFMITAHTEGTGIREGLP